MREREKESLTQQVRAILNLVPTSLIRLLVCFTNLLIKIIGPTRSEENTAVLTHTLSAARNDREAFISPCWNDVCTWGWDFLKRATAGQTRGGKSRALYTEDDVRPEAHQRDHSGFPETALLQRYKYFIT